MDPAIQRTWPPEVCAGARPTYAHAFVTRFRYLSFLTDYGLEDGFVAACHGVAARIAPHAAIIDVTHLVPPGDIRRGAAVLAQTVPYLPPAVHVAVVDPGVGTARRGVAVAAGESVFVGPDNGLLSWAVDGGGRRDRGPFSLTNRGCGWTRCRRPSTAGTSSCRSPRTWRRTPSWPRPGEEIDVGELVTLPAPERRVRGGASPTGEVLTVDRFGNVQLSHHHVRRGANRPRAGRDRARPLRPPGLRIPYREMFGAVAPGSSCSTPTAPGWSPSR